jgi:cytosine/adenosine deaminase-related metal-dependent hydrolase
MVAEPIVPGPIARGEVPCTEHRLVPGPFCPFRSARAIAGGPAVAAYRVVDARLPAGSTAADLSAIDLRGGMVLSRFVNGHTHLDKAHLAAPRAARYSALILASAMIRP